MNSSTLFRKRSPWRAAALVPLAMVCALTAACGDGDDSGASDDQFVIGLALSQSGNMTANDKEPGQAALMAIEELNEKGGFGGREIRVIQKDVRSNPETVAIATQELISEGADLIVTPADFDLSAPGLLIAQKAGVPAVSIGAGDPKTSDQKTVGEYAFTANAGSDVEGSAGAAFAIKQGWKTAVLLQDESIEYTKSAGAYFTAKYEELGGEILETAAFQGGDNVDVSAQIATIRGMSPQPQFIYVASWNPGASTAMKQVRAAGIELPIVTDASADGQTLLDIVGNASDIYVTAFGCYVYCTGGDEALGAFVESFEETTGAAPSNSYALLGYNMILAFANAFEDLDDLDGKALVEALQNAGPVETPVGPLQYFSPTCNKIINFPLTVMEVSGGQMSEVGKAELDGVPGLGDGNSCAS